MLCTAHSRTSPRRFRGRPGKWSAILRLWRLPCFALVLVLHGAPPPPGGSVPPEMALTPLPSAAPEPPDNPGTPGKIELGRLLFFDPILSAGGGVACATCHHPNYGWADGRSRSLGVGGAGLGPARIPHGTGALPSLDRNAPSLVNVGFIGRVSGGAIHRPEDAPLFWDSRVSGLESQAWIPVRDRSEMRGDACPEDEAVNQAVVRIRGIPEYRQRFAAAFGGTPSEAVTALHVARALAAFERSLVAAASPYDRFLRGDRDALTAAQQRGLQEFQDAGCVLCHGGPMLSDFKLHVVGVPDADPRGRRAFRTPSLRQLPSTGPYMHHGGIRSLDEVLQFYEELMESAGESLDGGDASVLPPLDPLLRRLDLHPGRNADLLAFLESLQDESYDRTIPKRVPSGLPVGGR